MSRILTHFECTHAMGHWRSDPWITQVKSEAKAYAKRFKASKPRIVRVSTTRTVIK